MRRGEHDRARADGYEQGECAQTQSIDGNRRESPIVANAIFRVVAFHAIDYMKEYHSAQSSFERGRFLLKPFVKHSKYRFNFLVDQ